ncbi:MAG: c-type cytochrome [Bacteroidota bacterium]
MKTIYTKIYSVVIISVVGILTACNQNKGDGTVTETTNAKVDYGGFESNVKYGEHLVTICGCNDCHTPKKMGANGMELDSSLLLSGHPSQTPCPDVDRKKMESKGVICTNDLTAWVGPWGVSYTANLTPDPTGIGNWDEATFMTAIRMGKFKGIESGRGLLPPMPWEMIKNMTDKELEAVFAYLKSIPPIRNIVPAPELPALAAK